MFLASAAMLVGARGGNAHFAAMAEPLAQMLDKDAAFGSADRRIASELRGIAAELQVKAPNVDAIAQRVARILDVARG